MFSINSSDLLKCVQQVSIFIKFHAIQKFCMRTHGIFDIIAVFCVDISYSLKNAYIYLPIYINLKPIYLSSLN